MFEKLSETEKNYEKIAEDPVDAGGSGGSGAFREADARAQAAHADSRQIS